MRGWLVILLTSCALMVRGEEAPEERYALIVSGASGGPRYAEKHARWRTTLHEILTGALGFDGAHVTTLFDAGPAAPDSATRANVRRAVMDLKSRLRRSDLLLVILLGHGSSAGADAKFNLVGPDLEATEWATLLQPLPATLVIVNTASSSFPFLERLSGPRRVVITATDSAAQRFETVFPEFFIAGLADPEADIDKNARVSLWEAFNFASTRVRQHYEQRGQLSTERPLLDDNGDAVGKEAGQPGADGAVASRTYLDAEAAPAVAADPALLELLQRRASLESQAEELKLRKAIMPPADYEKEFERLMIELATVSREIRNRRS
ncbi:MAG: hypothetical protein LC804_12670 [Acidobacteria bacterium]|nr:hypothetical protein [Acidobacteriota bacterium]